VKLSFTRRADGNNWLHAHSTLGSEPTTYGNPIAHERIFLPSRKFMFVSDSDIGEKSRVFANPKAEPVSAIGKHSRQLFFLLRKENCRRQRRSQVKNTELFNIVVYAI
jgi:hypothetical protein